MLGRAGEPAVARGDPRPAAVARPTCRRCRRLTLLTGRRSTSGCSSSGCSPAARFRRRATQVTLRGVRRRRLARAAGARAWPPVARSTAIHVDHGLRPDRRPRPTWSRGRATRFGAAFRSPSASHVAPGPNLEARARAARYAALPRRRADRAHRRRPGGDRAAQPARGCGDSTASPAMRPEPRIRCSRLRRAARPPRCARRSGIAGRRRSDQPSTAASCRNRVRHELLPLLADVAGRDLVPVLCRAGRRCCRDDDDLLDAARRGARPDRRPRPRRRAAAARQAGGAPLAGRRSLDGHRPDSADRASGCSPSPAGDASACELAGGLRVDRSQQRLDQLGTATVARRVAWRSVPAGNIVADVRRRSTC